MGRKRLTISKNKAYFHLMSRTVGGEKYFGIREREVLRKMIWQVADFSGIRVLTYAVMTNHFHILVEAPPDDTEISDQELVRRYRRLYPKPTPWQPMSADILERILSKHGPTRDEMRQRLIGRMHNISWLMRTIKQRFTRWYNLVHERFGTLWSERFKSVLVEGDRWALRTVAAYIDLNPVRAGLVEDPKDYRFSGYGEAMGGGKLARAGLNIIDRDLAGYRQTLYGYGSENRPGKRSFSREEALEVLETRKGKLSLPEILRCRIRYFSEGIVIGSPEFVQPFTRPHAAEESGGPAEPHKMQGAEWKGLSVARGFRKDIFG